MNSSHLRQRFNDEEMQVFNTCRTPEAVQIFLNSIQYSFEHDGVARIRSLRRVLREKFAHCFEGALAAAAILQHHGFPPKILCMEACDIDHMLFLYQREGLYGSVAQSRDENLKGRSPTFDTVRDLVMSYYPHYWNSLTHDRNDFTLRGYAVVDFGDETRDWVTAEEDLWFLEDRFYTAPYTALFPGNGATEFLSNRDGSITWLDGGQ